MVLARRDQLYIPQHFWSVVFTVKGSAIPTVMPRSIPFLLFDIGAALLQHFGLAHHFAVPNEVPRQMSTRGALAGPLLHPLAQVIIPFALLIGLLFSFRITSAYSKWERAAEVTKQFHGRVTAITSRVAISLPRSQQYCDMVNEVCAPPPPPPRPCCATHHPAPAPSHPSPRAAPPPPPPFLCSGSSTVARPPPPRFDGCCCSPSCACSRT